MIGLAHRGHSSPSTLTPSFMLVAFVIFFDIRSLFGWVDRVFVMPMTIDHLWRGGLIGIEEPMQESCEHCFRPVRGQMFLTLGLCEQ